MYSIHYGGRWVWLAAYMPVQNITGGWMALFMVTYSFIADNSSPRLHLLAVPDESTGCLKKCPFLEKQP